jgi:hypothetical protein
MPDPTPAAYLLFSWMRQGFLAGSTNATGRVAATQAHLAISLPNRLRVNVTRDVSPKSTATDAMVREEGRAGSEKGCSVNLRATCALSRLFFPISLSGQSQTGGTSAYLRWTDEILIGRNST